MQYVNFVYEGDDQPTLHTGPVPDRYTGDSHGWFDQCKQNIENSCGDGVRLKSAS